MMPSSFQRIDVVIALLTIIVVGTSSSSLGSSATGSISDGISVRRTRLPPNSQDPDYIHATSSGGHVGRSGEDGAVVFIAKLPAVGMSTTSLELRAQYFARVEEEEDEFVKDVVLNASATILKKKEVAYQQYIVPGDGRRGPYDREVTVKVWGAGGGGCDGGRGEVKDSIPEGGYNNEVDSEELFADDDNSPRDYFINKSEGSSGGYVEATFLLPVGDILQVTVGGGGMSRGSQFHSLGGKGGFNGGNFGRSDFMSGGGGGGGMSVVSWNGTILLAAFGGDGGGNTTYCTAQGGSGGLFRDRQNMMAMGSTTLDEGGYINLDLAVPLNDEIAVRICPSVPMIDSLTHDSAAFTWNAGSHQHDTSKEFYVQKYIVSFSSSTITRKDRQGEEGLIICSGAFSIHEHIQRSFDVNRNATTKFENLKASTPYCLCVEAFSSRGLSLGKQTLVFHTKSMPINKWIPVSVQQLPDASTTVYKTNANDGNTDDNESTTTITWCEHSSAQPSGRRGHSMTVINDHVYIFGGATLKSVYDATKECSSKNVYSSELWHFDPLMSTFSQLGRGSMEKEINSWPSGREQHSMTALPNGNLILIGGRTSSNSDLEIGEETEQLLLADVWTMRDPHHIFSSLKFSSNHLGQVLPIKLIPGHVTSHRMPIELHDDDGTLFGHEEMCIRDVQVRISLDRICSNAIEYILLTGPGTTFAAANHDALQSIEYETKIFVSGAEARHHKCHSTSSVDLLLSDNAKEWVLSFANIPESGYYSPANSLMGTFDNMPIRGEWVISIAMAQPVYPEENPGARLLQWELTFDAKSCAPIRPQWRKLSNPPSSFSPRRLQTAVAVENSIFVTGGFAKHRLNDLWRYDYDSNSWVELNHASSSLRSRWPISYGQVSVLGPFGLLAFGGLSKSLSQQQGRDLRVMNIFDDDWASVHIPRNESVPDGYYFDNSVPDSRYLSSIGLLVNVDSTYKRYSIQDGSGPMILVFGGDGKILHNAYADSYGYISNTLFDDVWLFSPGGIRTSSSMYQRRRDENCNWRWDSSSMATTAHQVWNSSCGWKEKDDTSSEEEREVGNNQSGLLRGECHLESILIAAWCREQYQSFYVP